MRLTQEQVAFFEREGYLLVDGFLSAQEVAFIQDCYMQTIERLRAGHSLENVQSGGARDEDYQARRTCATRSFACSSTTRGCWIWWSACWAPTSG